MIKLADLIRENRNLYQQAIYPVIVGTITDDGDVKSTLSTGGSHGEHNLQRGKCWRYNPKTHTVYWWRGDILDLERELVEDYLQRKYSMSVDKHLYFNDMNVNYQQHYKDAHGYLREIIRHPSGKSTKSEKDIFGLGIVDVDGIVRFKMLSREYISSMTHQSAGLPLARDRFRYNNGNVEWTDNPSKDSKLSVEDYLFKHHLPFKGHYDYWSNQIFHDDDLPLEESNDAHRKKISVNETYIAKMSDKERDDLAMNYFDIGHDTSENNYYWIWDNVNLRLKIKKGGTHAIHFGHTVKDYTYSGWYDVDKNTISIVFPEYELRKLGNKRPTEDDIPERIYQALIRTFGKRKPKFVVFETIKKSDFKKLLKEIALMVLNESQFRGEWWFQEGNAVFADGDVGDMNHEAYVIDALRRQVLEALGVDSSRYDPVPNYYEVADEILQNIEDELTYEEKKEWMEGTNADIEEIIYDYLKRKGDTETIEKLKYINSANHDPREYALVHWGWQRVKGNVIQTQTLTSEDLSHIVSGLYDAYPDELEENDPENITDDNPMGEPTFNIEVVSTKSWYVGVPISVLEKKNPTALNLYRTRY